MTSTTPLHVAAIDQEQTTNHNKSASPTIQESCEMKELVDSNDDDSVDPVTARKERKLLWKIDLMILPLLVTVNDFRCYGGLSLSVDVGKANYDQGNPI